MTVGAGFALALAVTVALLTGAVVSGRAARRSRHLAFVACAVVALVVTIVLAERYGRELDLTVAEPWTSVHLSLAKIATFAYLLPLASGIATLRRPARRALHKKLVYLTLALTAATFLTGAGMILHAAPREPPAQGSERRAPTPLLEDPGPAPARGE